MKRRGFLSAFALPLCAAARKFTEELWASATSVYSATLIHPFLKGLADGSLPRPKFQFYLAQDALYLEAFARALGVLASKSPKPDWAIALNRDAVESLEGERQMHREILASYGATAANAMAPSNYAYTNHLLVTVERGTFCEGLAALLPCYWIYWEVGKELRKRGSANKDYQRWIQQYSSDAYGKTVQRVLAMMDEQAAAASASERERARQAFITSARYEYLFWDAAWKQERWPP